MGQGMDTQPDAKTVKAIVEWLRAQAQYPANTRLINGLADQIERGEPFSEAP